MTRIALLSTSDTDLLSARSSGADYALANPSRLDVALPGVIGDADLVVVRLLGSVRSWQDGFDVVLGAGFPVVVLGGEQTPDAELMSHYSNASLPRQFDAFVWFDETSAVTPLGPEHARAGAPDTYPFGV